MLERMYAGPPYLVVSHCDTMGTHVISGTKREQIVTITTLQYLGEIILNNYMNDLILLAENCRLKYLFVPTIPQEGYMVMCSV